MKKLLAAFILSAIVTASAGCANNESGNTSVSGTKVSNSEIKIEEIDWSVNESIMDGERTLSLDYTNNSRYTILQFDIKFTQREDVNDDDRKIFDYLKETGYYDDEDIKKLYILGSNRRCASPGETVTNTVCSINNTYRNAESMSEFSLMEPDMATIAYIANDGKGYTEYYDFKNKTYGSSSGNGIDLHQWSDTDISKLLPKAEYTAVKVSSDYDDRFFFYAFGVHPEEYEAYVSAVKEAGFTDVQYDGDRSYRALNGDNYEANITYNSIEETMTGCVERK